MSAQAQTPGDSDPVNAPRPACGHPGFCEPGSDECLAKDEAEQELEDARSSVEWLASGMRGACDDEHARKALNPTMTTAAGPEPAEVPMHPTNRDLDRLTETLTGRPLYVQTPHRSTIDYRLFGRLEHSELLDLLTRLVEDARHQLDRVRGEATLMHRGRPELVAQAAERWRHDNPGLSRLLELAYPEGSSPRV